MRVFNIFLAILPIICPTIGMCNPGMYLPNNVSIVNDVNEDSVLYTLPNCSYFTSCRHDRVQFSRVLDSIDTTQLMYYTTDCLLKLIGWGLYVTPCLYVDKKTYIQQIVFIDQGIEEINITMVGIITHPRDMHRGNALNILVYVVIMVITMFLFAVVCILASSIYKLVKKEKTHIYAKITRMNEEGMQKH